MHASAVQAHHCAVMLTAYESAPNVLDTSKAGHFAAAVADAELLLAGEGGGVGGGKELVAVLEHSDISEGGVSAPVLAPACFSLHSLSWMMACLAQEAHSNNGASVLWAMPESVTGRCHGSGAR